MVQSRNRCNQRVSWGLTCDLNPHSSKVVHSMQLCMLHMSPLSLFYNWCCKDIVQQHNCTYMCYNLEYLIQFCWILCIFCNICSSIRSVLTPDTRGCVPLVLERSPACVHVQWFIQNIYLTVKMWVCEISDRSVINMSSARTQMREEHRGVKSNQE